MSFVIQAPFPNLLTTLLLPSPNQGNQEQLRASVQTLRAMDGTLYTFVKAKRGRRGWRWEFRTAKDKALEVKEFISKYAGGLVKTVDHEGTVRIGYITINPLETRGEGRAGGWGGIQEAVSFTIEFEEKV